MATFRTPARFGAVLTTTAALALTACGGVDTTTGGDDGGDYPSGAVEMYVGADPGGSSDLISRAVATGLTDELGETFSVINKPGSNGALGRGRGGQGGTRRIHHRHPERFAVRHHPACCVRGRGHRHRRLRRRPGRLAATTT